MKQTSIEWLEMELKKLPSIDVLKTFEKAKQMHKEEIIESYLVGQEVTALYATTGKSSQTSI